MHPHATQSPLTYTYALPAMYIHNNIRIAQSETLYTNDHLSLKRVASITTTAKRNFTKIVSLKNSTPCMWYIQYERILIPCMKNDKHVTIPRIIAHLLCKHVHAYGHCQTINSYCIYLVSVITPNQAYILTEMSQK